VHLDHRRDDENNAISTSRHFAATQPFSRFRSEADIHPAALTEADL
jgi:hypothetical protein